MAAVISGVEDAVRCHDDIRFEKRLIQLLDRARAPIPFLGKLLGTFRRSIRHHQLCRMLLGKIGGCKGARLAGADDQHAMTGQIAKDLAGHDHASIRDRHRAATDCRLVTCAFTGMSGRLEEAREINPRAAVALRDRQRVFT